MAVSIKKVGKTTSSGEDTAQPENPAQIQTQPETAPRKKRRAPAKSKKPKNTLDDPKNLKKAQKVSEAIERLHDKSDEELFEEIQPKPENADKGTHKLDKAQQEARLVLMHRLLIRKVSGVDIQRQLGVSEKMYYYLKAKLDAQMRLDVSKLDVPYMIGDSLAFYEEVRSMALMMTSSTSISDPKVKLAAMNVALKAEQDKNAFLVNCGVYAPAIVEHLVRGLINSGRPLLMAGENTQTKNVDQMVGELLNALTHVAHPAHDGADVIDVEPVQLDAQGQETDWDLTNDLRDPDPAA